MRFQFLMCTIYLCLAGEHSRKCAHAQHLDWFVCLELSVCVCVRVYVRVRIYFIRWRCAFIRSPILPYRIGLTHIAECAWNREFGHFIFIVVVGLFMCSVYVEKINKWTWRLPSHWLLDVSMGCFLCSKIVNCFRLMWKTSSSVWEKKTTTETKYKTYTYLRELENFHFHHTKKKTNQSNAPNVWT